jgi:hypothetical protein
LLIDELTFNLQRMTLCSLSDEPHLLVELHSSFIVHPDRKFKAMNAMSQSPTLNGFEKRAAYASVPLCLKDP